MDSNVVIRAAVYEDIPQILELCKSVDRVIDFDEMSTFMHLDPEAIIVAEHPEDRKVIATCSGIKLGPSLGFMGLYMVHQNYRNQGIGKRLWDRALKRLGNINVGVRGDYLNFQNYKERYDFKFVADYVIAYYECYENSVIKHVGRPKFELSVATFFEGDLVSLKKNGTNSLNSIGWIDCGVATHKASANISENFIESNVTDIPFCRCSGKEKNSSSTVSILRDTELHLNDGLNNIPTSKINAGTIIHVVDNTSPQNYTKSAERKENSFKDTSTIFDTKVNVKNSLMGTSSTILDKPGTVLHNNSLTTSNKHRLNTSSEEIKTEAQCGVCGIIGETSLNTYVNSPPETAPSSADTIINGVLDYDRRLHKRDRSSLVTQTLSWESCRCKVAIDASSGSVVGFGCLRPSVTAVWILSPIYADSEDIALVLLQELLLDFDFRDAPRGVQIRFPFQESRGQFLEKLGFSDTGIRISTGYTKECIDMETDKIFSFHSTVFCSE